MAHAVIGMAIEVHRLIGPGYKKDLYIECLKYEFAKNEIAADFVVPVPIQYKDVQIPDSHTIDCLVEGRLLLKFETSEQIQEALVNSVVRTLKQEQFKLGLIINFHASLLKNGIRRINNRMGDSE